MINQLLLYLGMLLIGAGIGYFNMTHKKLDQALGKLQLLALIVLLFTMGIRLGGNPLVLEGMVTIGMSSFVLALGGVIGSVLMVFIGRKALSFIRRGGL